MFKRTNLHRRNFNRTGTFHLMLSYRRSTKNCSVFLAQAPLYIHNEDTSRQYFYHPVSHVFERQSLRDGICPSKTSTPYISCESFDPSFSLSLCKGHPWMRIPWYSERCLIIAPFLWKLQYVLRLFLSNIIIRIAAFDFHSFMSSWLNWL